MKYCNFLGDFYGSEGNFSSILISSSTFSIFLSENLRHSGINSGYFYSYYGLCSSSWSASFSHFSLVTELQAWPSNCSSSNLLFSSAFSSLYYSKITFCSGFSGSSDYFGSSGYFSTSGSSSSSGDSGCFYSSGLVFDLSWYWDYDLCSACTF